MQKVQQIIGADLSKRSIDLFCPSGNKHFKIDNSPAGFKELLTWLKKQRIEASQTMIVMEHTGLYSFCFEEFLRSKQIAFAKVNALGLKRSMGMVRGKSDKIDAARIASYGLEKRATLKVDEGLSKQLQRLQMLYATRERLVRHRAALLCAVKEYKHIGIGSKDLIMQSQLKVIDSFTRQIEKLQQQVDAIIAADGQLNQNFCLLTSVKGVGKVVALATLIKTRNFTRFSNARKFACFCGTAPFEHTSGTSIRGKTRVSHLADKEMKTLLDLAAKSAIRHDPELKAYYQTRISKGKGKMSTINIVRNKLITRMFAVIKRQTPFVEDYLKAA